MRGLRIDKHTSGWGQDTQVTVASPPPFIADYLTSKTGSWAIFNKICQNDITRYCHTGIINLLFSKLKKLKLGGGSRRLGHGIFTPGCEENQDEGEDTPENFNLRGQAAHGYMTPGVKLPRGQDKPVHLGDRLASVVF